MLAIQYEGEPNDLQNSHIKDPNEDPAILLAIKVCSANTGDLDQFQFMLDSI